ncbi:MAG: glycosyltransferase [Muribaculaceae bacterium]|nr:glycosyltransferase [Muribaculaceae bacterium]
MPELSVIVRVYNAETTLRRTLRSLAAQTATDVEYIFVNDGSTDESLKIIEHFRHNNPEFKAVSRIVSHDTNRGAAAATATGAAEASGRFITAVDSDDELTHDYYASMLACVHGSDTEPDVVCSPLIRVSAEGSELKVPSYITEPLDMMPIDTAHFALCNKLIRRSHFMNIVHDEPIANCWEDVCTTAPLIALQPRISMCMCAGYIYHDAVARTSASRRKPDVIIEQRCANTRLIERWMQQHELDSHYRRFLTNLKFHAKIKYLSSRPRDIKAWKNTFPEVNSRISEINGLSRTHRALFKLAAITPTFISEPMVKVYNILFR